MAQQLPPTWGSGRDRPSGTGPQGPPASTTEAVERAPFAWLDGGRVLLLEPRPVGWVLAELRFDPAACHYVEVRRVRYRWAREAVCALLGRALVAGEAAADRASRELQAWLTA